jgi:hypothetical protein
MTATCLKTEVDLIPERPCVLYEIYRYLNEIRSAGNSAFSADFWFVLCLMSSYCSPV